MEKDKKDRYEEVCQEIHVHQDVVNFVTEEMPEEETLYDLAELFKIFGDTTRIKILYVLFESDLCVCDIAASLKMGQSAISHQLRVLKQSSIVKSRRVGKVVYYSLADEHISQIFNLAFDHVIEDRGE